MPYELLNPTSAKDVIVSMCGMFVRLCVHFTVLAKRTNIRSWNLTWRSSVRICRLSLYIKVKGQGHPVKKRVTVHFNARFRSVPASTAVKEVTQEYDCKAYDTGCTQSVCVSFRIRKVEYTVKPQPKGSSPLMDVHTLVKIVHCTEGQQPDAKY